MDNNSLAHTKWECKYHIVFAPKYRRQVIYKNIRADVGQILATLCRRKGIEIIEAEAMSGHIHMLVRIPPKYSVSEVMGYLKGKSSLMIFEKHANSFPVSSVTMVCSSGRFKIDSSTGYSSAFLVRSRNPIDLKNVCIIDYFPCS